MSATSDGAACRSGERKYRWKREKRNLFSDLDLKKKLNNHSCITTCRNGWGLLTSRHLPHDESRWSWERNSLGWTSANSCISRSQLVCPSPFEIINQSQHSSEPDRVIEHQPNRSNISYWLWCFFFFKIFLSVIPVCFAPFGLWLSFPDGINLSHPHRAITAIWSPSVCSNKTGERLSDPFWSLCLDVLPCVA